MIASAGNYPHDFKRDYPYRLRRETVSLIRPREKVRSWDVVRKYIRSHKGEAFNELDYPWCEGICDAWDDPRNREIVMQFSARLGKTMLAQALMIAALWRDPSTAMFATATEKLLKETIRDKYYPMFERFKYTRKWVPIKSKRVQSRVDLAHLTMYGAWGGSVSGLADKDPKYKHGGEISKWTKQRSEEAEPLELFMERGIEIPDRKTILESTPSVEGVCRVNNWLVQGTDCRYQVPCPKCGSYQQLVMGDGKAGGIIWDRNEKGDHDATIAFNTARYRCDICRKEITEDERAWMIRRGMWVSRGQHVTKYKLKSGMAGKLRGNPANDGEIASFQLSRIYAPTFTFGDIARRYVQSIDHEERMRNTLNSWLGETYRPIKLIATWEEVGERLTIPENRIHHCPVGSNFITCAVDVQMDHYVYVVIAWGSYGKGWVINYGTTHSESEMKSIVQRTYPCEDNGPPLRAMMTFVDARDGNRQDEVVDFCSSLNSPQKGPWVWPCMGTGSKVMNGNFFNRNEIEEDGTLTKKRVKRQKKSLVGFYWISINTNFYQQWIQNSLVKRKPLSPGSIALPNEAIEDRDFLEQLINEQPVEKFDSTGHSSTLWVAIHEHVRWDFRDCVRYCRCAAEVYLNGKWQRIPDQRYIPKDYQPDEVIAEKSVATKTSSQKKKRTFVRKTKRFIRKRR